MAFAVIAGSVRIIVVYDRTVGVRPAKVDTDTNLAVVADKVDLPGSPPPSVFSVLYQGRAV